MLIIVNSHVFTVACSAQRMIFYKNRIDKAMIKKFEAERKIYKRPTIEELGLDL